MAYQPEAPARVSHSAARTCGDPRWRFRAGMGSCRRCQVQAIVNPPSWDDPKHDMEKWRVSTHVPREESNDVPSIRITTYDEPQVAIYGDGGNCTREPGNGSPCSTMRLRQVRVLLAGDWLGTTGVRRRLRAPHDTTAGVATGYRGMAFSPPPDCPGDCGAGGIGPGGAGVATRTRSLRLRVESVTPGTDGTVAPSAVPGSLLGRFRVRASRPVGG